MGGNHSVEGKVGENIGIMHYNRFGFVGRREHFAAEADPGECATGVEEHIALVAYLHQTGERLSLQFGNYLVGEMMNIYNQSACARVEKLAGHAYKNRLAPQWRERLGVRVGKWSEPGAYSSGKDNSYHSLTLKVCCMSCSRWTSSTLTLNFFAICSAVCWAQYTDRC